MIHAEYGTKVNGEIIIQKRIDCNPFHPSGNDELKWIIMNITGNDYLLTPFFWSWHDEVWFSPDPPVRITVKGSSFTCDEMALYGSIKVSSDELTVELEEGGMDVNPNAIPYDKLLFRRMTD